MLTNRLQAMDHPFVSRLLKSFAHKIKFKNVFCVQKVYTAVFPDFLKYIFENVCDSENKIFFSIVSYVF